MVITRKIQWISSRASKNQAKINRLQENLVAFYSRNDSYYEDIDFTEENWTEKGDSIFQDIIGTVKKANKILEIGCGSSNILKHNASIRPKYTGIDFSDDLIGRNRAKYPESSFHVIDNPNKYSFNDGQFDLIFSTFVLEHVCFPHLFLMECERMLSPNGILIILCPNFLGRGDISSQRKGFGPGTGMEKLRSKKFLDAFVTGFDSRIRLPIYCFILRNLALLKPRFYININPLCFKDDFQPDVDAVYLTYKMEIINFLSKNFFYMKNSNELNSLEKRKRLIYLKLKKITRTV